MHALAPLFLFAVTAPIAAAAGSPDAADLVPEKSVVVGQMTIHERIIVRVPRLQSPLPVGRTPIPVTVRWREKRGPKCIAATDLSGALVSQPGSVDFVLDGGDRLRAMLDEDCGPLDFYSGFYLRPASDGKVCADRDVIRVRSGGSCTVKSFRRLVAAR